MVGAVLLPLPLLAQPKDEVSPEPIAAPQPPTLPLARFVLPDNAPGELNPLLQRVLDASRVTDPFDPEDDERQLRRLRATAIDVLATEGFFTPRISVQDDAEVKAQHILRVDPGPRAVVRSVSITLQGAIETNVQRISELVSAWELAEGQPFRNGVWATAKTRLLARVQERDYPAAELVQSDAEVNPDDASVKLTVVINSGPAFTLGSLQVGGLQRYDVSLVDRFGQFFVGEPYDATKLLEFQRRLQASPYFKSVTVDVPVDASNPTNVPIDVEVAEAPSKRVSVGVGFSTNTGPRLETLYRHTGLFGFPYTLQTGFGVDDVRQVIYADLLLPPKPNGALDSLGVLADRNEIQGVLTRRYAVGAARTDTRQSKQATFDTKLALNLQRETTLEVDQPESTRFTNDTLSLSYTWTRRTVDSLTDPRRGDVLTLRTAGGVSRSGLSDLLAESFFYSYGRYVRYIPVFTRDLVILRGEVGHVVADDLRFVPQDFRFRAGGAGSVRGYAYQSLGLRKNDQGSVVQGSSSLAIGSAEYIRWFTEEWGGAVFYDVGDADDQLLNVRWARGYGLGARWRTLAGPLALDLAYGERDKRVRLHFSIAISF